jgi:alpha-L-rhamnosidase
MKRTMTVGLMFLLMYAMSHGSVSHAGPGSLAPGGLRCQQRVNPLGIDGRVPRLSWIVRSDRRNQAQTAYQVLVSTNVSKQADDIGDLWDSGKVASHESINVSYQGKDLHSSQRCLWKVRVWDKDGKVSDWSETAWWEMGLLEASQWQGHWINDGKMNADRDEDLYDDDPAPLFRKEFAVGRSLKRARLYISGLGYYEATLNGDKVGDHVLDPLWTNYGKRVFYNTYDVTKSLNRGDNCIGVALGNGWYNPLPLRMWGHRNIRPSLPVGRPIFIAQLLLEYQDGTGERIVSNRDWKVTQGPILRNSVYLGERYDARREVDRWAMPGLDDSSWSPAVHASAPQGSLQAQFCPAIKISDRITPVSITEPSPDVYIVDMGQNFGGWVSLSMRAERGTEIRLRYGELLYKDGQLNPMTSVAGQIKGMRKDKQGNEVSAGGPGAPPIAWQQDVYIAKGQGLEVYVPRFTFHAFRYVEITGLKQKPSLQALEGLRLHCDVEPVGAFSCSNEMFNRIQDICLRTFLSNIFGVQSDCPHREKFGYGGDLVTTSDAFMLNYDMSQFYAKAVYDWADAARPDGMLTDTAPFVGIQYCGVAWAMAHPHLLMQLYQYYGDRQLLQQQYEVSRRWFELVIKQTPDHIIKKGLSDHEGLESAPAPVMVTPLYCESARIMARAAGILGRTQDQQRYQRLAEQIKQAYVEKFVDSDTGKVGPGTQASQVFALSLNMIDSEAIVGKALDFLVSKIEKEHKGHLSTGIFGTKLMLDLLSERGHMDLAHRIVNQKDFPGWGYMLENGATTLWEHWAFSDNTFSHNHPMFGSVSQWFYNRLGGIRPHAEAIGFDRVIIQPEIMDSMDWVLCTYNSMRGPIACRWKTRGEQLWLDVDVPVGVDALVHVPMAEGKTITESDMPIDSGTDVVFVRKAVDAQVYRVGSGRYRFVVE